MLKKILLGSAVIASCFSVCLAGENKSFEVKFIFPSDLTVKTFETYTGKGQQNDLDGSGNYIDNHLGSKVSDGDSSATKIITYAEIYDDYTAGDSSLAKSFNKHFANRVHTKRSDGHTATQLLLYSAAEFVVTYYNTDFKCTIGAGLSKTFWGAHNWWIGFNTKTATVNGMLGNSSEGLTCYAVANATQSLNLKIKGKKKSSDTFEIETP